VTPDDHPAKDEVEVTVFGPGYGESIVMHLGERQWIVVDSCVDDHDEVPALRYLSDLGVDFDSEIVLVAATHWHDDHVRGISRLVRSSPSARFACSAAVYHRDIVQGIGTLGRRRFRTKKSGVQEMHDTLTLYEGRTRRTPAVIWTRAGDRLWEEIPALRRNPFNPRIDVLAPSHRSILVAYKEIARSIRRGRTGQVRPPDRNDGAVVMWVHVGDVDVLLGADLEIHDDREMGWEPVVERGCPYEHADVFKVAHHGSVTGHHAGVWGALLGTRPHAIVTPWQKGGNYLPTPDDVDRLRGLAGLLHLSAPPGPRERHHLTAEQRRRRRWTLPPPGRVTLRRRVGGEEWTATYADPAKCLN